MLFSGIAFAQNIKHVDATTFFNSIKNEEGLVLDVRTPGEYSRGHIEGSTLISVNDRKFVDKVKLLRKDQPIYVYCLTGSRSRAVANYLGKNGYNMVNLSRGIIDWKRNGYPVIQGANVIASSSKSYSSTDIQNILTDNDLVLIDFYAPWCAPCKKIMPVIDKIESEEKSIVTTKVDIDANKELQASFNAYTIPTLVIYKKGKEVWRHEGTIAESELRTIINKHVSN